MGRIKKLKGITKVEQAKGSAYEMLLFTLSYVRRLMRRMVSADLFFASCATVLMVAAFQVLTTPAETVRNFVFGHNM
ncbi:hypothetical protein AO277_17535 [Pseudomonas amygdali]|nr:hypothetical protein AO277_17535 [Pseudomonas amygdali]